MNPLLTNFILDRALLGFTAITLSAASVAIAAAERPELTDQIIVHFENASSSAQLRAPGLSRAINQRLSYVRRMSDGSEVYRLDQRQDLGLVKGLAQAIEAVFGVRYAEPDQLLQPLLSEPNDQFYSSAQWHYQGGSGGLNAPGAWAEFPAELSNPVIVAVLDTGYRPHVDLVANLVVGADLIDNTAVSNDGDGRDMDPLDPGDGYAAGGCGGGGAGNSSWHGTHVAGTIAADTDNGFGVAGVTYNMARVMPVRVLGRCGGYLSDISDGIRWAVGQPVDGLSDTATPARVINMSLGGSGACSTTYQSAIDMAVGSGAVVVVAAGNANADAADFTPANCNNVISVAATNSDGGRSYYSNYGSRVDLAAPGGEMNLDATRGIASTLNDGAQEPGNDIYAYYQGTSMAAPHVSGVAALMLLKNPSLTPAAIETWLVSTARPFPNDCTECGAGIVDAGAAVAALGSGAPLPALPSAPVLTAVIDNQDATATLFWDDSDAEQSYLLQRQQQNRRKWSGWSDTATLAADQISYLDSSGTGTYRYRIRAENGLGVSDWSTSEEVIVTDSSGSDSSANPCRGKKC